MDDFDLSSFDTFDLPERRRELLNTPVSDELLKARQKTERMVRGYNAMNAFLVASGRGGGSPMSMPTYDDSPSTSDVAAADEQAATEFMRSLDKIRQQVGRDLTENERNSLARAYGLGPKGLATLDKYFKFIGKTDADLRAEAGEQRAISAEQRAIAGEERAATTFQQGQKDRSKKETEEERYRLMVREASTALRKSQDSGVSQGEIFAEQQRIRSQLQKRAELFGLDPVKAVTEFDKLIANAPSTKEVLDTTTGQLVFRSDAEINAEQDRYTPVRNASGQLSTSLEASAFSTFDELNIDLVKGLELLNQMDQFGPKEAINRAVQNGNIEDAKLMTSILVTMNKNKDWFMNMIERSFDGSANQMRFE
jgi:hypothetical protein